MELSLLHQLGELLSNFSDSKCSIIQLESIFRFILKVEAEMGTTTVLYLKDKIFSLIKEKGTNISLEQVNAIASSLFKNESEIKFKFLDLFSNDLKVQSFSTHEFEEIDIDLDASLAHSEETFHINDNYVIEDSNTPLYGTDKCPCACHTDHCSPTHCFICAMHFVQGCTYTACRKDKTIQGTKSTTESTASSS